MSSESRGYIKPHYYWLDTMRFLAAFMVLLSHARNTFSPPFGDLPIDQQNIFSMAFTLFCRMGHEAVIVFFVLSGFLVGGRGFERIKDGSMNVGSYAIDRFARICPPLLAAILFYYITSLVIPGTPYSWATAIGNLFSLQGICCKSLVSPFWSLSYEVWFYIILGALALLLKAKKDGKIILGMIVFVAATSVFVLGLKMHYLLIWMMGAVAYLARPQKKNKWVLLLSLVGLFAAILYYQLSKDTKSIEFAVEGSNNELIEVIMSLMVCLLIQQVILYEPKKSVSKWIEKKVGGMAKFSYTLYLSHRIVFLWIVAFVWAKDSCQFTLSGIVRFMIIIIATLFICWLLYLVSERYSPSIKKYMKKQLLKA